MIPRCRGNYDESTKCRVFNLPKDNSRQSWINTLPPREDGKERNITATSDFYICIHHWPVDTEMVVLPGGHTKPTNPPSVWPNIPPSCLPTAKPPPREPPVEDRQLKFFQKNDKIKSFADFCPENQLKKKYKQVLTTRTDDKIISLFMADDYSEVLASVIVFDKGTLTSPLTLIATKNGIRVPLGSILEPNNGLKSKSQFFDAVHTVLNYKAPAIEVVKQTLKRLDSIDLEENETIDAPKRKKLCFLKRQFQLICDKSFTVHDFCFAVEAYPRCPYEQLREVLVLPSKRKIQSVFSATGKNTFVLF